MLIGFVVVIPLIMIININAKTCQSSGMLFSVVIFLLFVIIIIMKGASHPERAGIPAQRTLTSDSSLHVDFRQFPSR